MRRLDRLRGRDAAHLGLSLGALLTVAGALHAIGHVNPTTAAVSMLVTILLTATWARFAVAVVSSIAAMLALNFFFYAPLYTFTIEEPENWVALFAFLIVSVVASQLSIAARTRAREAEALAIERIQLITERQEADRVRQRADLASTLLASLSHDLRTPLTAVSVAVANLQDAALDQDERQRQARLAAQELDRLTRLFRDILDMARIDASALTLERDWVTPADIVDAAMATLRPTLDDRPVDIEADDVTTISVDPRLTSAALAHLIENAVQYSPADSRIRITGRVDAAGLHLSVRDQGPGLEPQELERVFERFYRGRRGQSRTAGTGMGLAIARGLVAAEGGVVRGENAATGGAEFSIVIPTPHRTQSKED